METLHNIRIQTTPTIQTAVRMEEVEYVYTYRRVDQGSFINNFKEVIRLGIPIYKGSLAGYRRFLKGEPLESYMSWLAQTNGLVWFNESYRDDGFIDEWDITPTQSLEVFKKHCINRHSEVLYKQYKRKQQICHEYSTD